MSEYIQNIIAKRERPIYGKPHKQNTIRSIPIDEPRFAIIQEHAASTGESMNAFVIRAINEAIERDNKNAK